MYTVVKYIINLQLLRNGLEKLDKALYLFLRVVQINYIFSDNVHFLYMYTFACRCTFGMQILILLSEYDIFVCFIEFTSIYSEIRYFFVHNSKIFKTVLYFSEAASIRVKYNCTISGQIIHALKTEV
jgi:hypothetical protein